ncbi:DNA double-strand break repair nuclease NurA [Thermosipho sp. (in: thermotogales)]|uniref:DNA double-strand break repair nuclease NurA n=1 Tax=Thermosipho sp. (in: thermotogales) TaxID=1968895 RepID=UPI00257B2719|nr:DNA double-strand break repair nuclease NurA [Thermosipho sp. (in: thermotogales)]MBZ4651128.1 double-strand break repair nuclease NurA [Thermosipho sp. (in: thermotogales)]
MPYINEFSNKISHERIIKNPKVIEKLKEFKIAYEVPALQGDDIIKLFQQVKVEKASHGIKFVFTVDSSSVEIPLNNNIPSATVGIVNFSVSIVDLEEKSSLASSEFIDPQKFNDMFNSSLLTFVTPGHNVILKNNLSPIQSIRLALYEFFSQKPFNSLSLLDTLYIILKSKDDKISFLCPNPECHRNIEWDLNSLNSYVGKCPTCGEDIYLSDWLRLHEALDEEWGTGSILSRFSQVNEHLVVLNLIQTIQNNSFLRNLLKNTAFIIDGPLALYGEPAKLHAHILQYLHQLKSEGFVYFGIIKSGRLKDHFTILEEKLKQQGINIPYNSFMLVNDEYRFKYVQKKGKKYVLSLPYPVPEKTDVAFKEYIFKHEAYDTLPVVLDLLNRISIDLYEDAVLPIALAHKFASISLNPGVKILEIFTKSYVKQQ